MPLYEYECTACHRRTEKIQKFSDPEITLCPHCGGHLNRVLSAPAFSFAGGGWYADGYGSAKPAAASGGENKTSGAESKASGAESNSTPAAATPSNGGSSGASAAASSAPASAPAASADKK